MFLSILFHLIFLTWKCTLYPIVKLTFGLPACQIRVTRFKTQFCFGYSFLANAHYESQEVMKASNTGISTTHMGHLDRVPDFGLGHSWILNLRDEPQMKSLLSVSLSLSLSPYHTFHLSLFFFLKIQKLMKSDFRDTNF